LKLRYTPTALAELTDILAYIGERSPGGARNVHARIKAITALRVERNFLHHGGELPGHESLSA